MESYSKTSEAYSAEEMMKSNVIDYCLNTLRTRTIDEQLVDLSVIMKTTLVLKIAYDTNGLEVTYSVGSQIASVIGFDESACVSQCKQAILSKLLGFCLYTNSDAQTSSFLKTQFYTTAISNSTQDAYSEIELRKERATENRTNKAALGQIVLVGQDMDIPKELCEYVDDNKSPLILKVSYSLTDWEIVYELGPFNVSSKGAIKSTCMHQCKKHLLHELVALVNDAKVVFAGGDNVVGPQVAENSSADEAITVFPESGDTRRGDCEPSESVPTTEPEEVVRTESNVLLAICEVPENDRLIKEETMVQNKSSVDGVTPCEPENEANDSTAVESVVQLAKTTSRAEVSAASHAAALPDHQPKRSPQAYEKYVNQVTVVLKNVTRDTLWHSTKRVFDIIALTTRANRFYLPRITDCILANAIDMPDNCAICAELCCNLFGRSWTYSREFRLDLVQSCRDVLRQSGIMSQVETAKWPRYARQPERRFDGKACERSLGTCRFIGEMFMRDQMYKTTRDTFNTLMRTRDAHSLECLCVLLTIIGPKLKKIIDKPGRVFEQLETYSVAGYAGNCPLPQRTLDMIKTLLNLRQ